MEGLPFLPGNSFRDPTVSITIIFFYLFSNFIIERIFRKMLKIAMLQTVWIQIKGCQENAQIICVVLRFQMYHNQFLGKWCYLQWNY